MMIKIPPQLAFDIFRTSVSWGVALLWFFKEHIILEITISVFGGLLLVLKKKIRANTRKSYYRRKHW